MNGTDFPNRRKFVRIPSYIPVHYWLFTGEGKEERKLSFLKNVSVGGVLFASKGPIPKGSKFGCSVFLPSSTTPLNGLAEVVWMQSRGDSYEIGSRFLEIARDGKEKLSSYVEYELKRVTTEQNLAPEPLKAKLRDDRDTTLLLKELEEKILALKSFLEEDTGRKRSSEYLSLQNEIVHHAGALIKISKDSAFFTPGICLTNRITYILTQMGSWRNLNSTTYEQRKELELDISDALKLIEDIRNQMHTPA